LKVEMLTVVVEVRWNCLMMEKKQMKEMRMEE
jgi:hypothetical protein